MKYKVGDKVKIKYFSLYDSFTYQGFPYIQFENGAMFSLSMCFFCGKFATITKINKSYDFDIHGCVVEKDLSYRIDIDGELHIWTDEMFEDTSNCDIGINKTIYKNTITMENKKTFEPFERIIIRRKNMENSCWTCELFSHETKEHFETIGYKIFIKDEFDILPYDGNEKLVGTIDMPEEEVYLKEGELVAVADDIEDIIHGYASIRRFSAIMGNVLYCRENAHKDSREDVAWTYCFPFAKFNPNDPEETKKHILCVKNGRLVKAFPQE